MQRWINQRRFFRINDQATTGAESISKRIPTGKHPQNQTKACKIPEIKHFRNLTIS